jgi:hypothetical protein
VTFDTPSHLRKIPDYLFSGCGGLTTLTLPDSVTDVAPSAFGKSGVTAIIGSAWTIIAGLVIHLGKVVGCFETPSSIRIPGRVREIVDYAFFRTNSLIDLSFEEGTMRIGTTAFTWCFGLKKAAFPASLIVIEARAFQECDQLCEITFAVGSQLQYIRTEAFSGCPLNEFVIPASIVEIDPSAFDPEVWQKYAKYEGSPLYLFDDDFTLSLDSRVIFRCHSTRTEFSIGSTIEVIGAHAFQGCFINAVLFENGSRLREIGSAAFANSSQLTSFTVPESVEIIGDHCFESCFKMEAIEFEGSSRLKRIDGRAFAGCKLRSITIPALTEEIDGSAFVNCPFISLRVAPGNVNFKIEGTLLVTSDGTEIVRYFGVDREIVVVQKVKVLGKSCFEGCKHLDRIDFEVGSELERIGKAALRNCESLSSIGIPVCVTIIEEGSFEGCDELESCLIEEDSLLVVIGARAFAKCTSLRSFDIPGRVGELGRDCFIGCIHLYQLNFMSSESLKKVVGDRSLDDALSEFGVGTNSSLLMIEVEAVGMELKLKFPGWVSASDADGTLQFSLVGDVE